MNNWIRVTDKRRCPICKKDSWCTYNEQVVLCMRAQSNRPKLLKSGETGWLHPINGHAVELPKKEERKEPAINVGKLLEEWETNYATLRDMAQSLGVDASSLGALGCRWAAPYRAFAFPMSDGFGNFVGIRLRSRDGHKWAVRGSHQGIFSPNVIPQKTCLIVEGPTDCAAALTLGYFAIGRPSCSGGVSDCATALRRFGVTGAVIVADNDGPGINGVATLQEHLRIQSTVVALPCKDLRSFVQLGGTKQLLDSMISQCVWRPV